MNALRYAHRFGVALGWSLRAPIVLAGRTNFWVPRGADMATEPTPTGPTPAEPYGLSLDSSAFRHALVNDLAAIAQLADLARLELRELESGPIVRGISETLSTLRDAVGELLVTLRPGETVDP